METSVIRDDRNIKAAEAYLKAPLRICSDTEVHCSDLFKAGS